MSQLSVETHLTSPTEGVTFLQMVVKTPSLEAGAPWGFYNIRGIKYIVPWLNPITKRHIPFIKVNQNSTKCKFSSSPELFTKLNVKYRKKRLGRSFRP